MVTTNRTQAVEACTKGISQAVRNRADAMHYIDLAIASDNSYCLPHLVKAWMLHGANDERFSANITTESQLAQGLLPAGDSLESGLLAALQPMLAQRREEGVMQLERLCRQYPDNAYVQLLAHEETFWLGDAKRMRSIVEQAAPAWQETHEDYGPYLSLRAFANEEAGCYDAAERYGREAVEIDATDVWGAHAVAHVLLMKGKITEGMHWLDGLCANWQDANQMQHHLWWHYCLFLFETGEFEHIVELLHSKIRNPASELIKAAPAATIDNNNYASLLMRLELYGVEIRHLWQTLADICSNRITNHASVFSNIHDMMVLTGSGREQHARQLLDSMSDRFNTPDNVSMVADAYRTVGIPVCKAIVAHRKQDYRQVISLLGGVRHQLHKMGASPPQRDVFYHLLVHAARRERRHDLEQTYLQEIEQLGFCDVPNRSAYKHDRSQSQL